MLDNINNRVFNLNMKEFVLFTFSSLGYAIDELPTSLYTIIKLVINIGAV